MYAYFIDISQGSVEMHLQCGGIYNNQIIASCLPSVLVKEFFENRSIIGEDVDKSKVAHFWPTCININIMIIIIMAGGLRRGFEFLAVEKFFLV